MSVCFPEVKLSEHRQDGFFELPNKSQIWIGGLDDKERVEKILGQEYATLYLNECSQIPYSSIVVARTRLAQQVEGLKQRAYYDLNPGGANHWTNLEFGKHVDPISGAALADPENYKRSFISPEENAENLSGEFLDSLRNLPTKQRKRFFDGEYVDEVDGALWTIETLDQHRADVLPELKRIVVAIDPSGSSGDEDKRSDEVGIVAAGVGVDGNAYVLEDLSGRHGPSEWAGIAVSAYERWGADSIVAETNYGGAMVKEVIRAKSAHIPFREVKASRGKHVRAEPIATLYAQGKVRHYGRFPRLEDQLLAFSSAGYTGDRSPDRADAAVWAISDLFPTVLAAPKPTLVKPQLRPAGNLGAQGWMGR
jgi:phage terminase large subunit-like protein